MVSLGRHVRERLQPPLGTENQLAMALESHARQAIERLTVPEALDNFQHGIFTLPADHDVNAFGLQRLIGQKGWVPSAQDDRETRVPSFDGPGDVHRFRNHRSRDQRDA